MWPRYLVETQWNIIDNLRNIYWDIIDFKDRLNRTSAELYPPPSLRYLVGGGDFNLIGENFMSYFIEICNLKPFELVLDIGCGAGRMAIPLLKYFNNAGGYIGFDVSKRAIRWCKKNVTLKNSKMSFHLADIYNKAYNPRGKLSATEFKFPCEDESIDFAFATSVFTHMRSDDLRHYLLELERSLMPGGRALCTFFIIDDIAQQLMSENDSCFNFKYNFGDCYSIDEQVPEKAIAFSHTTLRNMLLDANLELNDPILYGTWSGRNRILDFQDVVVISKRKNR